MNVRPVESADRAQWTALRLALWPDYPPVQIEAEVAEYFQSQHIVGLASTVFVATADAGPPIGFAEVSLRPYASGCTSTPVGYLEGWYVAPSHRRQGVGKALVQAALDWSRSQGCTEFASDRDEQNALSRDCHGALGFIPANLHAFYRLPLVVNPTDAKDFIGIVEFPLDAGAITALVTDPTAGGLAVFLGTTRAEKNTAGQSLLSLHYESYDQMALQQLRDLAANARSRWPILKLALLHRTGGVAVKEPSVVIAVSTPHRADAFEACRFLIDELKKDVAIWKKEVWSDGTGTWVHGQK